MHRLGRLKVTHVKFLSAGFKNSSNSLLNRTYRTDYFFENLNKYRNLKFGKFWHSNVANSSDPNIFSVKFKFQST